METNNQNLPSQLPPQPLGAKKWYRRESVLVIMVLTIVAAGLCYAALIPKEIPTISIIPNHPTHHSILSPTTTPEADTTTSTPIAPIIVDTSKWDNPQTLIDQVAWHTPTPLPTSTLNSYFKPLPDAQYSPLSYMEIQEFGNVTSGIFQGSKIVDVIIPAEGIGDFNHYFRFLTLPPHNQWGVPTVLLQNYSDYGNLKDNLVALVSVASKSISIKDFELPNTIQGAKSSQTLQMVKGSLQFPSPGEPLKADLVFHDGQVGNVYTYRTSYENGILGGGTYYVHQPDNTYAQYFLTNDITYYENNSKKVQPIIWQDGTVTPEGTTYTIDDFICGSEGTHLKDLPDNFQTWPNLTQTGNTSAGDPVYEFPSDSKVLKDFYNNDLSMPFNSKGNQLPKPSYSKFIASHPLFVWIDPFGYKQLLVRAEYATPQGGCAGKPVIYLYPTQPTNVQVQVSPVNGISLSDPDYKNGWEVLAESNGTITSNNKTYPYLFWEGSLGKNYQIPKQGFVIKKNEVKQLLDDKLAFIGLSKKEISDFEEFWVPRMKASSYYFVTFTINQQMEQYAPLTITPKPDTVIRVLMDYTPLDHSEIVQPLKLPHTDRTGFTVVEWGGILK
jgi:hypothetical protein